MSATDLPWMKIWRGLTHHRKVLALQEELKNPCAGWWLIKLWEWARASHPDGFIPGAIAGRLVEMGCGWTGKRGRLAQALVSVGWLDESSGGLEVHDWSDWQGKVVEQAEKDRIAAQERRRLRREASPKAEAVGSDTLRRHPPVFGNRETEQELENPRRATVGRRSGDGRPQDEEEERDQDLDTYAEVDRAGPLKTKPPAPPATNSHPPDPEAQAAYAEAEDARAKRFDLMPNPNPPPSWEIGWRALLGAHEGDKLWAMATLQRWFSDDWAKKRSTPGDLRVFIAKDKAGEYIWRKHQGPRPEAAEAGCEAPGCPHAASQELGGLGLCQTHYYRVFELRRFDNPMTKAEVRCRLENETADPFPAPHSFTQAEAVA